MKRATVNQQANREMKKYCVEHGITRCELCGSDYGLTFAHKEKRRHYYSKPISWLWDRSQFRLLCLRCHEKIEYNKEATNKLFGEI
jgi:5-methylcytosine-specific restriction endonuclease McrA